MRDVQIKSKNIGSSIIAGNAAIHGNLNTAINNDDNKQIADLITLIAKQTTSIINSNEYVTSEDFKKTIEEISASMKKLLSEPNAIKKENHIANTFKTVKGILGSTTEVLNNFFQLAKMIGLG